VSFGPGQRLTRFLRNLATSMRVALVPDRAANSKQEYAFPPDPLDERDVTPPNASAHPVQHIPGAKEVSRNTFEVLALRGLGTPLGLGLVVLQSRALEPAGRGGYVIAVLGVTLITRLLGDLGTAATTQIKSDPGRIGPWTATALRASVLLGLAGALFLAISPQLVELAPSNWIAEVPQRIAILTAIAVTPALVSRCLSGIMLGAGRIRLWSVIQVLPNAISVAAFAVLVLVLDFGVEGAIAGYVAGHTVTAVVAMCATYRSWAGWFLRHVPWHYAGQLIRLAAAMGLGSFLTILNYRIELVLLQSHLGDDAAGIYSTSVTVAESLWLITTAIATALWVPILHESEERAARLVRRSALKSLALLALGAAVIGAAAPFAIPLIFSDSFESSVTPLLWLLPGIIVYGPVQVLTAYLSVRLGRPGYALAGPVGSLVVTVALAVVLIPEHGPTGAAIACTVGYFVGAAGVWTTFVVLSRRVSGAGPSAVGAAP
jgi:O-antigen/teichoic acid export membrane protein